MSYRTAAVQSCQKLVGEEREQFGNPEEGERPPLEAVTREMKTQQAEKT
jgi:hypothetical protein